MTATENTCDVCGRGPMIGVFSTSVPMSVAYCAECAEQGADPAFIFDYFLNDVANGDPSQIRDGLVSWIDGKYVTFHEWAAAKLAEKK